MRDTLTALVVAGALILGAGAIATPAAAEAARSTAVDFHNGTDCDLALAGTRPDESDAYHLDHGIWSTGATGAPETPPRTIPKGGHGDWESESDGFLTGTEGEVRYATQNCADGDLDNRQIELHWDNPYAGTNAYDSNGSDPEFLISNSTGTGDNTTVSWEIAEKTATIVSMGDSFISGEGGRWAGNGFGNLTNSGSAKGTDRAAFNCNSDESSCSQDPSRVYGSTAYGSGNGCDRSDVAEIKGVDLAEIPAAGRVNLACSGAVTDDVTSNVFKTETPQVVRLADTAKNNDVKMIVLSIGGNDIGFSDILTACATGYLKPGSLGSHCSTPDQAKKVADSISQVSSKVTATLQAIRQTMTDAGYQPGSYKLVLQSYPGPLARGGDNPYGETYTRYTTGGCPFFNDDSDWARDTVIPQFSQSLRAAARNGGADFLDLQDAFAGHELCNKNAQQATSANTLTNPLPAAQAEWVRWVPYLAVQTGSQGDKQEAVHPNAYGQQQLSACLSAAYRQFVTGNREFGCKPSNDLTNASIEKRVLVTPLPPDPTATPLRPVVQPAADADTQDHWTADPGGDQSRCRPEGMAPTPGVDTPYCVAYDEQGRERLGMTPGAEHPRRAIGYFTGWRTGADGREQYLPSDLPWGQLTHVNYAFAHVGADDRIAVGTEGTAGIQQLNQLKAQNHARVKTLISIGGWAETGGILNPDGSRSSTGGFYTMTTNADGSVNQAGINTFADSVVSFLRANHFNGADLDYEYPDALPNTGNPQDWGIANPRRAGLTAGYNALLQTLRARLDAAAAADGTYYLLSAAVSSSGYLLRGLDNFDGDKYLDYVNVMSYDFHGSWNHFVGPDAPLYDDGKDAELTAAGIYDTTKNPEYGQEGYFNTDWAYHYFRGSMPAGRIVLGIPYYTRGWSNVTGGVGSGLWGTADLPDQSKCPLGTGAKGGTSPCGSGATGVADIWHDTDPDGNELGAGANPMWHAKNLERGVTPDYLSRYGLDPAAPANQVSGYTRNWNDTLKASWLWNDTTKTFISTEDEQAVDAKAKYVADNGIGGVMMWELAGDYSCPQGSGQCGIGYTMTDKLDGDLRGAGPYGTSKADATEQLPDQVVDVSAQLVDYPTDVGSMWPMQPVLRITNRSGSALPSGTRLSFDIPTSTGPLVKDGAWHDQTQGGDWSVTAGRSGPDVGGLGADFHRVTVSLQYCEGVPDGQSLDIPIKYYLPITGPSNATLTVGGQTYGLASENRRGVTRVTPAAATGGPDCQAEPWDAGRTYNPVWAPFSLWKTGSLWKVQDTVSANVLTHPGNQSTAQLTASQDGNTDQLWNVVEDGGPGWYRIKSTTAGHEQCLGADALLGALSVRDCDGSAAQWWQFLDDKGAAFSGGAPADGAAHALKAYSGFVAEPRNSGTAAGTAAVAGDPSGITRSVVSYNGSFWKAKYWTKGNTPDATDPNNPWTRLGPAS